MADVVTGFPRAGGRCVLLLAAFGLVGFATAVPVHAAAFYDYFYTAPQSSYSASPGSSINIPIYLQELSTDATDPSLIDDDGGLFFGAFTAQSSSAGSAAISAVAGNPGLSVADFPDVGDVSNPTGFDDINTQTVSGGVAVVSEDENFEDVDGAQSTPVVGVGFNGVLLGTLTVQAGAAGDKTTFEVGPTPGDETGTTDYDLDDNQDGGDYSTLYDNSAPTTFTVTATPEPTCLAAGGVLAALGLLRRRRVLRGAPGERAYGRSLDS